MTPIGAANPVRMVCKKDNAGIDLKLLSVVLMTKSMFRCKDANPIKLNHGSLMKADQNQGYARIWVTGD